MCFDSEATAYEKAEHALVVCEYFEEAVNDASGAHQELSVQAKALFHLAMKEGFLNYYPGSDLLSHPVAQAVPSALEGLTAVFEMGTGMAPPQ